MIGSPDRPHKEAKKKPKAKSAQPSLSPMSEPPQNVEVIRSRARNDTSSKTTYRKADRPADATIVRPGERSIGSDEERDG